jgi:hypothetical protein
MVVLMIVIQMVLYLYLGNTYMTNVASNASPATAGQTKQIVLKEIQAKWGKFSEQDLSALKSNSVTQLAAKALWIEVTMPNVDANVIGFQCPKCGQDLQQTIGLLKSNQRLVCNSCAVGISFDTAKLAEATEILQEALEAVPNEITIKFFASAGWVRMPARRQAIPTIREPERNGSALAQLRPVTQERRWVHSVGAGSSHFGP